MPIVKPSANPTVRRSQIANAFQEAVTATSAERGVGIVTTRELEKLTALVKTPEDKSYLKDLFVEATRATPNLGVSEAVKGYFGGSVGGVEIPDVTLVKPQSDNHLTTPQLLVRRAVGGLHDVLKNTVPNDRTAMSHVIVMNTAKATAEALLAVDPKSAEGKRLWKALRQVFERANIRPADNTPQVFSGSGWVYVDDSSKPDQIDDQWAAATIRAVAGELRTKGRTDLLPPEYLR